MSHFPCTPGKLDYDKCNDGWHLHCENDAMLRETFLCEQLPQR